MKSQKLFSVAVYKNTLRRYWYLGVLNFILLFFAIPVNYLLGHNRMLQNLPIEGKEYLYNYVSRFFSMQSVTLITVIALLAGLLFAIVFFSYLHDKKQVNFYHSQPIARLTLYATRLVGAVTLFAGTLLLNVVLALIVCAVTGVLAGVSLVGLMSYIGYTLLAFITMLSIATLAAMLCGTVFAHVEMIWLLLFAPILVYISATMLFGRFFSTYMPTDLENFGITLSPFMHIAEMSARSVSVLAVVGYVTLSAVCILLGAFVYQKRKSERAQTALAFDWVAIPIRIASCFIAASLLGLFFDELGNFYFMIFGFVMGALLCHMFCQVQFQKDFKAMFSNLKALGLFLVCFAVFVTCLALDVTGFDAYLPKPDNIQKVFIDLYDSDVRSITGNDAAFGVPENLVFDDPLTIQQVLNITTAVVEQDNYLKKRLIEGANATPYRQFTGNERTIEVIYESKNGIKTARQYREVDALLAQKQLQALVSSDAYKQAHLIPQLQKAGYQAKGITSAQINAGDPISALYDEAVVAEMMNALEQDVLTFGVRFDQPVVLSVYIELKYKSVDDPQFIRGMPSNFTVNVYAHYENTLAVLAKHGIQFDKIGEHTPEDLQSITIANRNRQVDFVLEVTNKEQMEQVIDQMISPYSGGLTLYDPYIVQLLTEQDRLRIEQENLENVGGPIPEVQIVEKYASGAFLVGTTPDWIRGYFEK